MHLPSESIRAKAAAPSPSSAAPERRESDPHSLEQCFLHIMNLHGLQVDLKALLSQTARKPGLVEPETLVTVAEGIGVDAKLVPCPVESIATFHDPCILLLKDRRACVYLPADAASVKARMFIPGQGIVHQEPDTLEGEYFGYIMLLTPRADAHGADKDDIGGHLWKQRPIDWFWRPVMAYWPQYAEILVCALFINLFAVAMPLYTMNVYDRVVPNFAESTLVVLTLGVGLAMLFDFLLKMMRYYILERVAADLSSQYDVDLMQQFLAIPPDKIRMTTGEKAAVFRELQSVRDFYASRLVPTLVDLPFFLLFVWVIYMIAPVLAVVPIVATALMLTGNAIAQFAIMRHTRRSFQDMQGKSSYLVEMLAGLDAIRLFNAASNRLYRWRVVTRRSAHSAKVSSFMMTLANNFAATVTQMANVGTICLGVYAIHDGTTSMGGVIAATIICGRAMALVMGLAGLVSKLKETNDILRSVDRVFAFPSEARPARQRDAKGPFRGHYILRDVGYTYPDMAAPALRNIHFEISPGDRIGLIGKTGAGKSTLAKLLAGIYAPTQGDFRLDGFTLDAIHPAELRANIGVVPQQSSFFSGSIRDNILMGLEGVKRSAFDRAVELSGVGLFIRQTGQGLDFDVGENGARLSGGQQQAVALARAFLRDAPILVFDEPTTGMDQALEQHVKSSLQEFIQGRTFIMVTHRTSLLPLVGRLVLVDNAGIALHGPRDDVLKTLAGGGS